jgi:RNA polymerase sigma factor (sigma-70 family)
MRHRRTAQLAPPTDAELIGRAREGDAQAFAVLHDRHAPAANAAARALCRSRSDADDVVAEAFTRVLKALRNGNGPTEAFKPYLLQCVRNAVIDRSRRDGRIDLTEDPPEAATDADAFGDSVERALVADAFQRIPERWQAVLWHTEVEGRPAAELAPMLGLSPNAVAALAYRAREGLRQAYLQAHVQGSSDGTCGPVVMQLGAYARNAVSPRDRTRIERHLTSCTSCQAVHAELAELELSLRRVLVPAVLGAGVGADLFLRHLHAVPDLVTTVGTAVTKAAAAVSTRVGGRGDGVVRWMQSSPQGSAGVGAAAAAVAIAAASVGGAVVVPNSAPSRMERSSTEAAAAPVATTAGPGARSHRVRPGTAGGGRRLRRRCGRRGLHHHAGDGHHHRGLDRRRRRFDRLGHHEWDRSGRGPAVAADDVTAGRHGAVAGGQGEGRSARRAAGHPRRGARSSAGSARAHGARHRRAPGAALPPPTVNLPATSQLPPPGGSAAGRTPTS